MKAIPKRVDYEVIPFDGWNDGAIYDTLETLFEPPHLEVKKVKVERYRKGEKMAYHEVRMHCQALDGRETLWSFTASPGDYIVIDLVHGKIEVMGPDLFDEEFTLLEGE